MFLDSSLFPPDIEYTITAGFSDKEKVRTRKQVSIHIGTELFAVVNSDFYNDKWNTPAFIILRANMPQAEVETLPEVSEKVLKIMAVLQTCTHEELVKVLC